MWSKHYYTITLFNKYSYESVESVDNHPIFTQNLKYFK